MREPWESADAVRDATELLKSGKGAASYQAVIVDEAQDFPTGSFALIRAMVPEAKNDLFIVGDGHQRIYGRMVNLGKAGIVTTLLFRETSAVSQPLVLGVFQSIIALLHEFSILAPSDFVNGLGEVLGNVKLVEGNFLVGLRHAFARR